MRTRGSHHPVWITSLYSDDKIHLTIYLDREKLKALGLVGPLGKRGLFMVHLGLVGMRVALSYCNHLWLTYGPLSFTWS